MELIGSGVIAGTTGTSLVVPIPVGVVANDYAFLHVSINSTADLSITTPTGWTLRHTQADGTGTWTVAVFTRKLNGSEGASLTVNWTATNTFVSNGVISAHRGVPTSSPIDVSFTSGTEAALDTTSAAYAATSAPNSRVLLFFAADAPSATITATGGTAAFYDSLSAFRTAYAIVPTVTVGGTGFLTGCVYLDQVLPGSGTVTITTPSAPIVWCIAAVLATDTTSTPGVDSLFGLVTQPPPRALGYPLGSSSSDWAPTLSVQVANPNPADAAYWDVSDWDVDGWGAEYVWADASDLVRGIHWSRGASQAGQRPEIGAATITFANGDGAVSPWATTGDFAVAGTSWLTAGMLIRFGVTVFHDAIYEYLPFFTGTVESFDEGTEFFADGWVTVTAVETLSVLTSSNDAALAVAVGSGDTLVQRIARLLDAADWPYGSSVEGGIASTLQATTMANDKLTEVYLTVDSLYARAVAGSGGLLRVTDFAPDSGTAALTFSNYPAGAELPLASVQPYASTDRLLNRAVAACVGGTQQQTDDAASRGKFGTWARGYGFPRNDLICIDDATVLAVIEAVVADHANDDLGLSSVTLNADMDPVNLYRVLSQYAALGVEYRQPLTVRWVHPSGAELTIDLRVDGFTFDLMPFGPGSPVEFTATLNTARA